MSDYYLLDPTDDPYLDLAQVVATTSLGKTTIYRKMNEGEFPISFDLTTGRRGWLRSEVEVWKKTRPRSKV